MAVVISFALAVPHTPWVPERVESLARLLDAIGIDGLDGPAQMSSFRMFTDREPSHAWGRRVWDWGASVGRRPVHSGLGGEVLGHTVGATHLVQIQDDVVPAPNFWEALTAMVTAVPDKVIGLQGAHPVFRLMARDGARWARSNWMVGVGWVMPIDDVRALLDFRADHVAEAEASSEDDFMGRFTAETGRQVWHPLPTLIDHDTSIASTYANDHHLHRRPSVTWREFGEREIEAVDFWRPQGEPALVRNPHNEACWLCQRQPAWLRVGETGAGVCLPCANACASMSLKRAGIQL